MTELVCNENKSLINIMCELILAKKMICNCIINCFCTLCIVVVLSKLQLHMYVVFDKNRYTSLCGNLVHGSWLRVVYERCGS